MPISPRRFAPIGVLALALVLGVPAAATAQADPFNFEFSSGQTVAPFFDGWSRNADGSYQMHFGYINRNHVEEVHVPIGADNRVEPGERDQGHPVRSFSSVIDMRQHQPVPNRVYSFARCDFPNLPFELS